MLYNLTSYLCKEVYKMNKIVKRIAAAALSALLLTGTAAVPAFAAESAFEQVAAQTVQVTAADIRSYGFAGAVQDALNDAQRIATDSSPVTVKVAPGSYDLYWCLFVYSNTTLDLTGVTLKRQFDGNMLRTGGNDSPGSGVTGYAHKNITLIGQRGQEHDPEGGSRQEFQDGKRDSPQREGRPHDGGRGR